MMHLSLHASLRLLIATGAAALVAPAAVPADDDFVGGDPLARLLAGSDVHFLVRGRRTRGWVSTKWRFHDDGTLDGNLFSSAWIADPEPPRNLDHGAWRVVDDTLCVRWKHWSEGREQCYRVTDNGDGTYTASGAGGMLAGPFTVVPGR